MTTSHPAHSSTPQAHSSSTSSFLIFHSLQSRVHVIGVQDTRYSSYSALLLPRPRPRPRRVGIDEYNEPRGIFTLFTVVINSTTLVCIFLSCVYLLFLPLVLLVVAIGVYPYPVLGS